jgi:hypothetical protein
MNETQYFLQIASTFSVVLPIVILLWGRFHHHWPYKLFLAFLVFGFLIDLGGWFFYLTKNANGNWIFRYAYSLVEPIFLLWWVRFFFHGKVVKKALTWFLGLSLVFWFTAVLYRSALSSYYIFTAVALAFFAGFLVLEIIENKKSSRLPLSFWIAFGIFFYHLCTFFVKGLINEQAATELWFIQNVVNITTNIIYALGFWVCRDEFTAAKVGGQTLSNT